MIIQRAKELATQAHQGQLRDTGAPYITHPSRVAEKVGQHPNNTPIWVAAAWLHDTIEDTQLPLAQIAIQCGEEVSLLVLELTNQYTKDAYPSWNRRRRKEAECQRLSKISVPAKIIKMYDRLDNLMEIRGLDPSRIKMYAGESLLLANAVGNADLGLKEILITNAKELLK